MNNIMIYENAVSAGFPSPAESYTEKVNSLDDLLIKHPIATYFVRVKGNSMVEGGIHDGDMLIVDRSVKPTDNRVIIAFLDGEFLVKRLRLKGPKVYLVGDSPSFKPIEITPEREFEVWGVVIYCIHSL